MIFHCTNCNNDFDVALQPRRCPDCGSTNLRPATEDEWAEHLRKMGLAEVESCDNGILWFSHAAELNEFP